ncbi:MAG: ABC-F family ATP-binding cassette domain-containing protein [Clostridia bacterium]|nr:ABC-F family ATP-binding cassette domain-containing protein [Clostridia bacterium]
MSLLAADSIKKEYDRQTVLNGVTFRLEKGDCAALIGSNGAGKTTLLKILAGTEEADAGGVFYEKEARVAYLAQRFDGAGEQTALFHPRVEAMRVRMQAINEELATAHGEKMEALLDELGKLQQQYEQADGYVIESRIKAVAMGLGLPMSTLSRPLSSLSGGERMRAELAHLLIGQPDVLLLDEPTNHLDIEAMEWLEQYLCGAGVTAVIVSHDRWFLDRVATKTLELQDGTVVERRGNFSAFMEQKKQEETRFFAEKKRLAAETERQAEIAERLLRWKKNNSAYSRQKLTVKLSAQMEEMQARQKARHFNAQRTLKLRLADPAHLSGVIAAAEGVGKSFGERTLFRQVSFLIRGGDKVGIVGANGTGKSTLLQLMMGLDDDFDGSIYLGEWVRFGFLGQHVAFENEDLSVTEEVAQRFDMTENRVREYLASYMFYGDDLLKPLKVLSGGERSRLYLACLLKDAPDCLILDEPTNHLDLPSREALEQALEGYEGTVIAVSHDRWFLARCVQRVFSLEEGGLVIHECPYEEFLRRRSKRDTAVKKEKQPSALPAGTEAAQNRRSRAEERQARAASRSRLAALEKTIASLEEQIVEAEKAFGPDTPPRAYEEYQQLLQQKDEAYEEYFRLEEEKTEI